jgi:hypothetical protein
MQSTAKTVSAYLATLPPDRRSAIAWVRDAINARLPSGFEEKIQYGMISWCVPESALPAREVYNKQPLCLASLASQKHHMAVYLLGVYGDPKERAWFEAAYKKSGKKLDMGQSCVRFKSLDALPVNVIAEAMSRVTVERYVEAYRRIRDAIKKRPARAATRSTAKPARRAGSAPNKPGSKPRAAIKTKQAAPKKIGAKRSARTRARVPRHAER